ncbi:MAG: M28 family peptidase, partial [Cyclobacteriaceae bacterium]
TLLFLAVGTGAYAQNESDSTIADRPEVMNMDTVNVPVAYSDLEYWIGILASDSLMGRKNGTPYLDTAASFIATWYDSLGLSPLPGMQDYAQPYTVGNAIKGQNVVGWLEGSDSLLKNEYILLSAHYDHVGMGMAIGGDSLYNGANDNASGVATMLGIAKRLQKADSLPARSILFVAYGAEEIGLLGSRFFKENPPVPLANVVVNLNFEMTGHSLKLGKRNLYLTGAKYSDLSDYMQAYFASENWTLIDNPFPYANLFRRSDNYNLASIRREDDITYGIPAHTICTWGGEDHYHKPHDEPEFIDYENMHSLIEVMTGLVINLADAPERIRWTDENYKALASEEE